jgi:hypothetical protein
LNKEQQCALFVRLTIVDPIPPQTVKITGYFKLKNSKRPKIGEDFTIMIDIEPNVAPKADLVSQ